MWPCLAEIGSLQDKLPSCHCTRLKSALKDNFEPMFRSHRFASESYTQKAEANWVFVEYLNVLTINSQSTSPMPARGESTR